MTTQLQDHYDVVISGAGPCGATFANLLGKYGITTLLIDKEPDVLNIPRAVAICDEGTRILNSGDILTYAPVDLLEISRIDFANVQGENVFHLSLDKHINNIPMQCTFYQPQLERSIRKGFERFGCIHFSPSTELKSFSDNGTGVTVQLERDGAPCTVDCKYLIGSDGASSPIRKQLGIGFDGTSYNQDWLVIDIAKNPIDNNVIQYSIDPSRPCITMPLPCNKRRWEFVVKEDDDVDNLLSDKTIAELVSSWGNIEDMELERKAIYGFHARTAKQYSKGRVFLAGDSAHITPPFAGQGMMAGLRDAQNLSWKLAGVIKQQLTQDILQSYDPERIPQSKQVIRFAQIIGKFILPQSYIAAWVRDSIIKLLTWTGLYTKKSGLYTEKIPYHINGSLLRNFWLSKTKGTGVCFPQHKLRYQEKSQVSDLWIDNSFYIVSWKHEPEQTLTDNALQRWKAIGGKFITLSDSASQNYLVDIEQQYANFFRKKDTVVIRPDKMIVAFCNKEEINKQLENYLDIIGLCK